MTQGFNEFYGGLELQCLNTQEVGELCFEAGAASRQAEIDLLEKEIIETQKFLNNQNCIKQAEIDELRKRLAMYEREGYKLAPVEPTEEMLDAARRRQWDDLSSPFEDMDMLKYKAMLDAVGN